MLAFLNSSSLFFSCAFSEAHTASIVKVRSLPSGPMRRPFCTKIKHTFLIIISLSIGKCSFAKDSVKVVSPFR